MSKDVLESARRHHQGAPDRRGPKTPIRAGCSTSAPIKPAKKLGEEAVEVAIAALAQDKKALVGETADLLYHLLVVLESRGVSA